MNGIRAHVFVSGNVQGVFYRVWTKSNAKELGLSGWVKNLDDGRVEAVLEGENENVEQMLNRMRKGPDMAAVNDVEFEFSEMTNENNSFEIKT